MSLDHPASENLPAPEGADALTHAERMARALVDVARRTRFASRPRTVLSGGFQQRRGERIFRQTIRAAFLIIVAVPSLLSLLYYGLLASDQYVAEARFKVSGGEAQFDGIAAVTGLPSIQVLQNAQIVTNYVGSSSLVEYLVSHADLRNIYGTKDADWFARLDADAPLEKVAEYWRNMVTVSTEMPGGIVSLRVRAFKPGDSLALVNAVLAQSDKVINALNDRVRQDNIALANQNLEQAAMRFAGARTALEQTRNAEGVLDAALTAQALMALKGRAEAAKLELQQQYSVGVKTISPDAPSVSALPAKIQAVSAQIADIDSRLTSTQAGSVRPLSSSMTKLNLLTIDQKIAEDEYGAAAAALENAQITAESKLTYFEQFVVPSAPEEAEYPRRFASILTIVGGSLLIWMIVLGLAVLVRNNMA